MKERLDRAGNAFTKLDNLFADFGKSDSEGEIDKLDDDDFYEQLSGDEKAEDNEAVMIDTKDPLNHQPKILSRTA